MTVEDDVGDASLAVTRRKRFRGVVVAESVKRGALFGAGGKDRPGAKGEDKKTQDSIHLEIAGAKVEQIKNSKSESRSYQVRKREVHHTFDGRDSARSARLAHASSSPL